MDGMELKVEEIRLDVTLAVEEEDIIAAEEEVVMAEEEVEEVERTPPAKKLPRFSYYHIVLEFRNRICSK